VEHQLEVTRVAELRFHASDPDPPGPDWYTQCMRCECCCGAAPAIFCPRIARLWVNGYCAVM